MCFLICHLYSSQQATPGINKEGSDSGRNRLGFRGGGGSSSVENTGKLAPFPRLFFTIHIALHKLSYLNVFRNILYHIAFYRLIMQMPKIKLKDLCDFFQKFLQHNDVYLYILHGLFVLICTQLAFKQTSVATNNFNNYNITIFTIGAVLERKGGRKGREGKRKGFHTSKSFQTPNARQHSSLISRGRDSQGTSEASKASHWKQHQCYASRPLSWRQWR